jgi:uncharacterized protein (UPF0335 family)
LASKLVVRELVGKLQTIEHEMETLREDRKQLMKDYEESHGVDKKAFQAAVRIAKIRMKLGDSADEADQMVEFIDDI